MTTDCKALCAELLEIIDLLCEGDARPDCDIVARARAFLDQPEPEEPTDEEILNLSQEHQVSYSMSDGRVIYPFQSSADMRDVLLSFARALIAADRARWGRVDVNPPAKLAHGTVQCW